MAESRLHRYAAPHAVVAWDADVCRHAAECVRGLPAVFDPKAKPWIVPERASLDALAATIARCPSGALRLYRPDGTLVVAGGASRAEPTPAATVLKVRPDGPNVVTGDVVLAGAKTGDARTRTTLVLCRCGASRNKPFCDGTHTRIGFRDPGVLPADTASGPPSIGRVTVTPTPQRTARMSGPAASSKARTGGPSAATRRGFAGAAIRGRSPSATARTRTSVSSDRPDRRSRSNDAGASGSRGVSRRARRARHGRADRCDPDRSPVRVAHRDATDRGRRREACARDPPARQADRPRARGRSLHRHPPDDRRTAALARFRREAATAHHARPLRVSARHARRSPRPARSDARRCTSSVAKRRSRPSIRAGSTCSRATRAAFASRVRSESHTSSAR